MSIEIEGNDVYGLWMWWTPAWVCLLWRGRREEESIMLTEETAMIPTALLYDAEEWDEDDTPFAEDWIRRIYEECSLKPARKYRQEVSVTVEEAIQLGIIRPAEEDLDLGKDGGYGLADIPILAALWAINRRAKKCRDLAQANYESEEHVLAGHYRKWKEEYYRIKGQALHYLLMEGQLAVVGHHRFDGDLWAEVISGDGYTFHRPCPDREDEEDAEGIECDRIEAKPKNADEPPVDHALATLLAYLKDKPEVKVHAWPTPSRSHRTWGFGYEDDHDDCDDYDDEDW